MIDQSSVARAGAALPWRRLSFHRKPCLALGAAFLAFAQAWSVKAESPESQAWQAGPAAVKAVSEAQGEQAPAGQTVFSLDANPTFRDLAERPAGGGKYSVLPREKVSTSTLEWRETLKQSVKESPYQDMTLPVLIDLALQHNYSLQNSERNVKKAKSSYRASKADFAPFVDLAANALYSDSKSAASPMLRKVKRLTYGGEVKASQLLPTGAQIAASGDLTKRKTVTEIPAMPDLMVEEYEAGVDLNVTQPLLRGAGFNVNLASVREGRLNEMSAELSDAVNRREVALDVISQFFSIAISLSNIEVALASIDVRQRLISDTQLLVDLGMKIPSEIAKARVTYLREETSAIKLKDDFQNQKEDLLDLLGLPLTSPISFRELTGDVLDADLAGIPDRETAVHEALASRPEMLLSDISVRSKEIALEVAKNDTLPNMDASYSYTDREVDPFLERTFDLNQHRTWTAGLSVSIPLQNIRRIETRRRAELDLDTARTNRVTTERSIISEVDALLRQLRANEESIRLLRETVEQARFTLDQETELLKWGDRTVNQIQEAQDNYFQAQSEYNRQIMSYQTLIARVYRAIGRQLY